MAKATTKRNNLIFDEFLLPAFIFYAQFCLFVEQKQNVKAGKISIKVKKQHTDEKNESRNLKSIWD